MYNTTWGHCKHSCLVPCTLSWQAAVSPCWVACSGSGPGAGIFWFIFDSLSMTFDFRKSPDICQQSPAQLMAVVGGCNVCDEQCIHSVQCCNLPCAVFTVCGVSTVMMPSTRVPATIPPPSAVLTRRGALDQCQQPPATRAGNEPSQSLKFHNYWEGPY